MQLVLRRQAGLVLALMISVVPRTPSATVYGCEIDYPLEVEERYWAAISRYDLYPSGDELCTITALGETDLGTFVGTDAEALARRMLADFGGLWRATGNEMLQPVVNRDRPNGSSYWRFRELIDDRPVLNGGVIVETATASGKVLSIRARFLPDFELTDTPSITAPDARERAIDGLSARESPLPPLDSMPDPRLAYYFLTNRARLVWEVEVPGNSAQNARLRHMIVVDALNGEILAEAACNKSSCSPDLGVHRLSWKRSADAEFYEVGCARDAELRASVETVYVGQLTEVIEPFVTDSWCRVRACKLEGCSVWVGSLHAAAWPGCD